MVAPLALCINGRSISIMYYKLKTELIWLVFLEILASPAYASEIMFLPQAEDQIQ